MNTKNNKLASIKHFTVGSLQEYFEVIHLINEYEQIKKKSDGTAEEQNDIYSLWYRGQGNQFYKLLPTIFREVTDTNALKDEFLYSDIHLQEDYRYHHFKSKGNQLVNTFPETKIEWQELMQHHFTSTRLMDWSESAISALMFALEAFIDPTCNKELEYKRATMTPVIWVLNPKSVNHCIYDQLSNSNYSKDLINKAVSDICPYKMTEKDKQVFVQKLIDRMKSRKANFLSGKGQGKELKINGIVCLSAIVGDRDTNQARIFQLLNNGEFNPFFYLLSRYYADGLKVRAGVLPPLSTVHPYHSPRIQAQHGVFTVVPHYYFDENQEKLYNIGIDKRTMEQQALISGCLYKVRITNPAQLARDLLLAGARRSAIYPELQVYAGDIEAKKYYI